MTVLSVIAAAYRRARSASSRKRSASVDRVVFGIVSVVSMERDAWRRGSKNRKRYLRWSRLRPSSVGGAIQSHWPLPPGICGLCSTRAAAGSFVAGRRSPCALTLPPTPPVFAHALPPPELTRQRSSNPSVQPRQAHGRWFSQSRTCRSTPAAMSRPTRPGSGADDRYECRHRERQRSESTSRTYRPARPDAARAAHRSSPARAARA